MIINFKRVRPGAITPIRATTGSNAFDLTCVHDEFNSHLEQYTCFTGVAVEIPTGYTGLLIARSSIAKRGLMLVNGVGLIDSDYRGELIAKFTILPGEIEQPYEIGERCCQLLIIPAPNFIFKEASELTDTTRGIGGFGSTNELLGGFNG
jgi:dUTP pyrophosphatase